MKVALIVLLVSVSLVATRTLYERRKDRSLSDGEKAAILESRQPELEALEKLLATAKDRFGGLHRWLSVLLFYPPFVKIDDAPEGLIDRDQTDLGRRFNEELIAAEQFPLNISLQEQINFFNHCYDELTVKYSKEIAQAVKSRDAAPLYPGHRGMSKVFDEQFDNS